MRKARCPPGLYFAVDSFKPDFSTCRGLRIRFSWSSPGARAGLRHGRQKRIVQRGGQCFDKSENFEQPRDRSTGFAFAGQPLAHSEYGHAQVRGCSIFIKVQPVNRGADLCCKSTGGGGFSLIHVVLFQGSENPPRGGFDGWRMGVILLASTVQREPGSIQLPRGILHRGY